MVFNTSIYDYSFKQAIHSAKKLIINEDNICKHNLPITNQRNCLYFINASFINHDTTIPTSFNMIKINDVLAAHECFLNTSPKIINMMSASNEIINMTCDSISKPNYPIYFIWKMKKTSTHFQQNKECRTKNNPFPTAR